MESFIYRITIYQQTNQQFISLKFYLFINILMEIYKKNEASIFLILFFFFNLIRIKNTIFIHLFIRV